MTEACETRVSLDPLPLWHEAQIKSRRWVFAVTEQHFVREGDKLRHSGTTSFELVAYAPKVEQAKKKVERWAEGAGRVLNLGEGKFAGVKLKDGTVHFTREFDGRLLADNAPARETRTG